LHTLILINMGAITDLPNAEWFGDFGLGLTVHVIDSSRPLNLASMFAAGENAERILVWDDGEADKLDEEQKAWEALTVCSFPSPTLDIREDPPNSMILNQTLMRIRRTKTNCKKTRRGMKRILKVHHESVALLAIVGEQQKRGGELTMTTCVNVLCFILFSPTCLTCQASKRLTRAEREDHEDRLRKYYISGSWHGQSASGTVYILANILERVDNDLLW
jgi:cell division control protein 45